MKKKQALICTTAVFLAVCLGPVSTAQAILYDFGGVHDIDFEISEDVQVTNAPTGEPTTVQLLTGGRIRSLLVDTDSEVAIAGGTVRGTLMAYNNSNVAISSGTVENSLSAHNNSNVAISGGAVENTLSAHHNSSVTMSGGTVAGNLAPHDNTSVTISGGTVRGALVVNENSHVSVLGGLLAGPLRTRDSSQTDISGGVIQDTIYAYQDSEITIAGSAFNYGYTVISHSTGILTGTLANGDAINARFYVYDGASIALVPEPATVVLLGLGGLGLLRCRR